MGLETDSGHSTRQVSRPQQIKLFSHMIVTFLLALFFSRDPLSVGYHFVSLASPKGIGDRMHCTTDLYKSMIVLTCPLGGPLQFAIFERKSALFDMLLLERIFIHHLVVISIFLKRFILYNIKTS